MHSKLKYFLSLGKHIVTNSLKNLFTKSIYFILGLCLLCIPAQTQAQAACQIYNPNQPNFGASCLPFIKNLQTDRAGISAIIVKVADYAIFILGSLSVLMIIYAGFLFITDGGSGERSGRARRIIINVILGLILAVASYTIITLLLNFVSSLDISK